MPTPKSVVKVTKDAKGNATVTYTSDVDKAEYFIFELTRAALRDVGKFVRREFGLRYYKNFHKHTGEAGRSLKAKVYSSKNTIYPRVDIGLSSKAKGFYSMFQEFGTKKTKKLGLFQGSVNENIQTIREIEAKYLDYINADEELIKSKISEEEVEDED